MVDTRIFKTSGQGISRGSYQKAYRLGIGKGNSQVKMPKLKVEGLETQSGPTGSRRDYTKQPKLDLAYGPTSPKGAPSLGGGMFKGLGKL